MFPVTEKLRILNNRCNPSIQSLIDIQSADDAIIVLARVLGTPPGSPQRDYALMVLSSILNESSEAASYLMGICTSVDDYSQLLHSVDSSRYATAAYFDRLKNRTLKTLSKDPGLIDRIIRKAKLTPTIPAITCAMAYVRQGSVLGNCESCPLECPISILCGFAPVKPNTNEKHDR